MSLRNVLRVSLVLEWITIIFYVLLTYVLETSLPVQLQDYLKWEISQELTSSEAMELAFIIIDFVMYVISSVGLFFFKAWAKKMYIFIGVFFILSSIVSDPVVEHSLTYAVGSIQYICFGFILALLLFTNVYDDN